MGGSGKALGAGANAAGSTSSTNAFNSGRVSKLRNVGVKKEPIATTDKSQKAVDATKKLNAFRSKRESIDTGLIKPRFQKQEQT